MAVADLINAGPTLQVSVGPSRELIAACAPLGEPPASPCAVAALIDTGAHTSVLNPEVVRRLAMRPVGTTTICTPSTTAPMLCNRHHINVYFSKEFVIENVLVVEAPMGGVPYQCLIGRDILRHATLLYEGRKNQFSLSF